MPNGPAQIGSPLGRSMIPAMITSTETMLQRWKERKGEEIEVFEEFRLLTSEVISKTAFGSSYLEGQKIFDMMMKMAKIIARNMNIVQLPVISNMIKNKDDIESDKLEQGIKDCVFEIIQKKDQQDIVDTSISDYLGELIKASHDKDDLKQIFLDEIVDECKTFYFAGHETTTVLLGWTIFLIASNQEWQEKAREEVLEFFGQANPDQDSITRLKIMNMILEESLRLYPPVILVKRRVAREVRLGNMTLPPNTELYISPLPVHHDPKIWGNDVHLFKPDRFEGGIVKATNNTPAAFMPFGFGPRICVGSNFAMVEAKIALAMILQRFKSSLKHCHVSEVLLVYQEIGYLVEGDKLRGEKGVVYNMELSNGGNNVNTHHGVEKLKSVNRKSTMFELVHTDLMGSMKPSSYSGYCNGMVLVDDCSKYTWVKFLKEKKSEALKVFADFKNNVEKDNNGILRQMTCAGTPQQNGVSERKLAHLTSMSRSWLHDKSIPLELWAEAIQCACYVTKRLPPWPVYDKVEKDLGRKFSAYGSDYEVEFIIIQFYAHQKNTVEKPIIDEVHDIFPFFPEENESQDVSQVSTQYEGETSNNSDEDQASRNHVSDDVDVEQSERRPARDKRQPSYLDDYEVNINNCSVTQCFFTGAVVVGEPTCYEEAKGKADWEAAMKEEIEALNKNQTWVLVQKPQNCKPVTCKWVYRLKKNPDGSINRCKARLVARGFSQSYGLDYEETFSPVAKMVTLRTIFSLAAYKSWKVWQLDVKNAFLYGELDRDVFMEQPTGYISKEHPHYVCRLKRIFGLKKGIACWFDSSLFIKLESQLHLLVLLYVDDKIITGDNEAEISLLKDDLSIRFEMKNLGEAGYFLGLEVENTDQGDPMEPNLKLRKNEGTLLKDVKKYRQLVGSLIYLTITRLELSYCVGKVSEFMQCPRTSLLEAAKMILQYVKGYLDYGLLYKKTNTFCLNGFTDADWGGNADDRHSTTGYCFSTGSAMVSWCSKNQSVVTLSSTEAKYVAATMTAQECMWLKRLVRDMMGKFEYAVKVRCDNESTIKLASNPVFHARTKHIEVRHHYIREKVLDQEIELKGILTERQVADIFTKALEKPNLVLLVYQEIGYLVEGDKLRGEKGVVYNMELSNRGNNVNTHYGIEKLVGTNYKYWRMCMEAFLQGQDLWDLVAGEETIPADTPANADLRRKWKVKCGKALFALRTSISKEFIDHVRDITSPKEVWETLERLFSKKYTARLQFLENELAVSTQGGMSISEYFLKVKSLCAEISELDVDEKISEARLRRFLIRCSTGLNLISRIEFEVQSNHWKYVLFGPSDVKILDNVRNLAANVIVTGKKKGSLFVLSADEAYVKKTSQNDSAAIWHARLGHIGYQLLQQISSKRLLEGIPVLQHVREDVICQGCQFGKSHRLPCQKSVNRKSTMFELVHTDLMGSMKPSSYSGYCNGMVLVDDCSKYTWVKFLKEKKSEALKVFVDFKNNVEKDNNGILRQMTCAGTPQQNGVSERKLAHLTSMSRSWLHDKSIPLELWAEAIQCACYVTKRLPPWPGWKCMDPEIKKFITSWDVLFDEVSSYYAHQKNIVEKAIVDEVQDIFPFFPKENESQDVSQVTTQYESVTSNNYDEDQSSRNFVSDGVDVEQIEGRPTRDKRQPSYLDDYEVNINNCSVTSCFFTGTVVAGEPTCYEEAKGKADWEAAMKEEIEALNKNQTWCKARLVARGFSQSYGLDYEETFSPVAKMVTLRTIFSLAAYKNWKVWQLDVKNAFLYGELERDVFMEQPTGYVSKEHPYYICRLKKALYGLKQAPRAWYGKVAQYLNFCGFKVSADSSLFIKLESKVHLLVLLYVDDKIITGDNEAEISMLKDDLSVHFEMKNLGEAGYFLGLEVENTDQGYFISQRGYAKELLQRFSMDKSKDTGIGYSLKDKNEAKTDKTEHGIGKSTKNPKPKT
ncbi:integrase [Tanacetum coccineum]